MFDGIRLTFTDEAFVTSLVNNQLFDTKKIIDNNAEIKVYLTEFKGLKITMNPNGYTVVKGSLHKYWNNGKHNHCDFTIHKLKEVIASLEKELNITPEIAIISNLEFGVNIITAFNPNDLIDSLTRFKNKQFNVMKVLGNGNGRECYSNQYGVKIYNKGLQYSLPNNLLRIEKKITVMCALRFGKLYLSDLLNISLWKHCKKELLTLIDNLTVNEPLNIDILNNQEEIVYNSIFNQSKWASFSRDRQCRYKKAYREIISKYSSKKYIENIIPLVNSKCDELLGYMQQIESINEGLKRCMIQT